MRKIILILAALTVFAAQGTYGQNDRKNVAVIPAEGESVSRDIRVGVTQGLEEGVFQSGEYKLLARGRSFEKALSEMQFQQSGAVSDSQLTEFGHAAGADFVCFATVSKFSETSYRISFKMIDVASGEIVNVGSETVRDGVDGLLTATDNIAKTLFGGGPVTTAGNTGNRSSGRNQTFTVSGATFEMVYVQGGSFMMGATSEQGSEANTDEKPAHSVTLSDFYIGKFEVTQQLWRAVMGENPSRWKGDNLPVEQVSWADCQTFVGRLNSQTGKNFRLPTEAEWEYAARGGNKSNGYRYSGSNDLYDVAWYRENSDSRTHEVGGKRPNELGIYDMSGNVWEWCRDWYDDSYYGRSPAMSPTGPSSGFVRVLRGGSWRDDAQYCRSAYRGDYDPSYRFFNYGFRLVFVP